MTLTVDDVRQFATFQIKSDPYKGLVLVAAVLLLMGLVDEPAACAAVASGCVPGGARTAVRSSRSAGCPGSEGDRFAAEFDDVARALARR